MSKKVKFKVEERSYPRSSAIVDIDVDDGVQEVTFGGDTWLDVDLYDVKKQFPDVKRLIIMNNIASISISNFMFPNVEDVVSYNRNYKSDKGRLVYCGAGYYKLRNVFIKNEGDKIDLSDIIRIGDNALEGCMSTSFISARNFRYIDEDAFANYPPASFGPFTNGVLVCGNVIAGVDTKAKEIVIPPRVSMSGIKSQAGVTFEKITITSDENMGAIYKFSAEVLYVDFDTMMTFTNWRNMGIKKVEVSASNVFYTSKDGILYHDFTLKRRETSCPNCGSYSCNIKEYKVRKIKHSAYNQRNCVLLYHARRFVCKDCGRTFYEPNPFVATEHSISKLTIINVLNELKEYNSTFSSAAKHNNISSTQAEAIFDDYVNIPRQTLPRVICIDEIYSKTSRKNKYSCLLLDFETSNLIDVIINRRKTTLLNYFEKIPKSERENVEYVSMDLYETYRSVVKLRLPKAKVCADPFHVIKNYNEALDKVRKRVMNKFPKKSVEYYLLKKFNWTLFKDEVRENESKWNKKLHRYINYPQILDLILGISDELRTAYDLKSDYVYFNKHSNLENAENDLWKHIEEMKKSNIQEILKLKKTLINWSQEIINSFTFIDGRRITNGIMESKNGIAKEIKNNAKGYKNFLRYRNRCLYCMNKTTKPNYAGSHKSIRMKGWPRGRYKKNK